MFCRVAFLRSLAVAAMCGCLIASHTTLGDEGDVEAQAASLLEQSEVAGGLVVHLGCGDGKLTAALGAKDGYLVQGFDTHADAVADARSYVRSLNRYGRVAIDQYDGRHLPLIDNLVNLVIIGDDGDLPDSEIQRVLCPGGVAISLKTNRSDATPYRKPRPDSIDEWTHYLHGPDNNAVAHDSQISTPFHMQWVGGPKWARHHNYLSTTSAMVSSGGRMFTIIDEAPAASLALPADWHLVARDAFNGVVLWKKQIGPWEGVFRPFRSGPVELSRRLVAVGDRVYVTLGYEQPVVALDAASGDIVRTYGETKGALEIVCEQGVLYIVAGTIDSEQYAASQREGGPSPAPRHKRLIAVDAESGKVLWQKADADTEELMPSTLAVSGGKVYFHNPTQLICLADGKIHWRFDRPLDLHRYSWSAPTVVVYEDLVLSADHAKFGRVRSTGDRNQVEWRVTAGTGSGMAVGELIVMTADEGKELWRCPSAHGYNSPPDILVAGGLVWTGSAPGRNNEDFTEGRDPHTGEVKRRFATDPLFSVAHHHRCYRDKATDQYILLGRTGSEFIDLANGDLIRNCWVRGACQYGVMPANGLMYAPPHSCACYIQSKLSGLWALRGKRATEVEPSKAWAGDRLLKGPAFGEASDPSLSAEAEVAAWPTHRGNMARTGRTEDTISTDLEPSWQASLGGKLSSPVIAGGKLLVAAVDQHAIHALNAATGQPAWQFTAGGRIDSPPTIAAGLALFGSADGYAYCLRLDDGQLVWRFRVAPADLRTVAFGQVESLWPVTGTPLVRGESVYFTSGRSSFLDGGMNLVRLDLQTGRMMKETRFDDRDPASGRQREETVEDVELPGALPDILVDDGQYLYLRDKVLDYDGADQQTHITHLYSSAGLLDDHWWHRTSWLWGERNWGRASGWAIMPGIRPSGRLLVTDEDTVFGFGRERVKGNTFEGYHLFRADKQVKEIDSAIKNNNVALAAHQKPAKVTYFWSEGVPMLARGLVLTPDKLLAAGPVMKPEDAGVNEPHFDGDSRSVLMAFNNEDGSTLARIPIESQPVFDGMAVAGGRVYMATVNGNIVCLGQK